MSDNESLKPNSGRVRSEAEINGEVPCARCGHEERYHSEMSEEEEDAVDCHVPDCPCDGWVAPDLS